MSDGNLVARRELVEISYFDDSPAVRDNITASLRTEASGYGVMTDYYWRLYHQERVKIGSAITSVVIGITVEYPEFTGIGVSRSDGWVWRSDDGVTERPFTTVALIRNQHKPLVNSDRTASSLLEVVNSNLSTLGSPFSLETPATENQEVASEG